MARPLKEIDEEQVFELAKIGCTYDEMAVILKCGKSTLQRRFEHVIKEGWEDLKQSVRRAQLGIMNKGNAVMAIWLGKQILRQSDNPEDNSASAIQEVAAHLRKSLKDMAETVPGPSDQ